MSSVAAAGAVALALLGVATAAGARGSYSDTAGDNVVALDISSVSLSETADGPLTVAVAVANAQTMPPGSRIDLWFDLDSDQRTGDEGDEALARYLWNGTLTFFRWNGSDLVRRPALGVTAGYAAGTLTYAVPRSALDNDSSFGVLVVTRGSLETEDDEILAFDALPELGRMAYLSPGPASFPDRTGDVPATPDVTAVEVSDAKDGTVRFAVTTPSHATPPPDATVTLAIDRDLLGESDAIERADVVLGYADGELELHRYDEQEDEWIEDKSPRARAGSLGNGVLVFEVHRTELDDVARFGLNVLSSVVDEDDDTTAYDVAPDRSAWRYVLAHRPPLRLIAGDVEGEPERPLAGRPFTISLPVRRSDTSRGVAAGTVACTVRAGGRAIKASGSIRKGLAACTVRVPRNAVAVHGSMVVRSAGKSVTAWFAGAIDFGGGVED